VRSMGRNAAGVRGVTLANDEDKVVGMVCLKDEQMNLLVVSEKGFGKKSAIEEYRITNRGGKGVKTLNITEKTGFLVGIHGVLDTDDLMIINKSGITIRLRVADLRVIGRATQGVRLLKINEGDEISSVAKIENDEKAAEEVSEAVLNQSELPAEESLNPDLTDPDLINEN
jgi:DNA gyrase subunit A